MLPGRKVDETDLKIIKELRGNGRASYREVAEKVGVAPGTVQNRVKELEDRGIIKSYHATVDWEKLGYEITAIIALEVESRSIDKIVARLKKNSNVYGVYTIAGEFDLFVAVKFKSMQNLNSFVRKELVYPTIKKTTTFLVLTTEKEAREFLEPGNF